MASPFFSPLAGIGKLFRNLFSNLFSLFTAAPASESANRKIFEYSDGSKTRREDPVVLLSRLKARSTYSLKTEGVLVDEGDLDAKQRMADVVCEVFSVQRFDSETGQGLTIHELIALLMEFMSWMEALKKNTSGLPIQSAPTESKLSESSDQSTTKHDLESCSTLIDPTSEPLQDTSEPLMSVAEENLARS